jgi:hypothetical protein
MAGHKSDEGTPEKAQTDKDFTANDAKGTVKDFQQARRRFISTGLIAVPVVMTLRSRPLWAQANDTPSAMLSLTHASHAAGRGIPDVPINTPAEPQAPSRWYWRDEPQNKANKSVASQAQEPSRWYWRH